MVDRFALLQTLPDGKSWIITHSVSVAGVPSVPVGVELPISMNPWAYEKLITKGEVLSLSNIDDAPNEANVDKKTWIGWGIRSNLNIPIKIKGHIDHIIAINSVKYERVWTEKFISRLRLLGEIFVNALERKHQSLRLEEQLRFEKLLAEISGNFISLPADRIDSGIESAQRRICELLDLDRSSLWQVSEEEPGLLLMTHWRLPSGSLLPPERMYAHNFFPWTLQRVLNGETVMISKVTELPPEAARDLENYRAYATKSSVSIPLKVGEGPVFGLLDFAATREERSWREPVVTGFKLIAQVFANALIRKQNETALRESERRLSLTTEAVGAGLWIMDVDTKKVWVSPKSRELFHFAPDEEIHYESYFRVIHPEDRDRVHQDVENALESGENLDCDYRIVLPDGSIKWIVARGQRFLKSTGEPDRMLGLSFDITERKQMEDVIRESEEKYRLTFSSVSDVIYTIDPDLRISSMTPNVEKILGYKVEELINRPFPELNLLTPESLEKVATDAMRVLSGEQISASVYEFIAKDGTRIFGEISGSPLIHEGKIIGITSVARDITERKQMEVQLKKSQASLDTLINSTPDLIWSVDAKHFGLLTFNSGLYDYFLHSVGLHIEMGMRPEDLFTSEEYVQIWHSFYKRLLSEGSFTIEYGTYRGNRTLRMNFNILKNDDKVFGISVFAQDITELKRMETQLREHLVEIENLKSQLEKENIYLREEIKAELGFGKIIGSSDALQYVLFRAQKVAPTDATVLILGETGVGKGMVAYAIHEMSSRKDKPMITVNCAALPANLIESELFGREKGAFTGSHARQVGRFEIADGGTIFLDEIGEFPLELQSKLLRVLQDGEFERLGSPRTIKVNVRVIASTSRDLKTEMRSGRFREDLYYRLNVFPVSLPPLRMRVKDIPELAKHFIDKYAQKFGRRFETISKDAMQDLQAYHWPGNVRELEHVIERAVITSPELVFQLVDQLEHEPVEMREAPHKEFEAMAREHILQVLKKTRWKIEGKDGAAAILGLNPSTLRFRIKKLGITRP